MAQPLGLKGREQAGCQEAGSRAAAEGAKERAGGNCGTGGNFRLPLLLILSKESACNAGDPGSTPGLGRSPGEGNGSPLQYSWLENPVDRGAWQATIHGVAQSWT